MKNKIEPYKRQEGKGEEEVKQQRREKWKANKSIAIISANI